MLASATGARLGDRFKDNEGKEDHRHANDKEGHCFS
jgi:hypothetical protein